MCCRNCCTFSNISDETFKFLGRTDIDKCTGQRLEAKKRAAANYGGHRPDLLFAHHARTSTIPSPTYLSNSSTISSGPANTAGPLISHITLERHPTSASSASPTKHPTDTDNLATLWSRQNHCDPDLRSERIRKLGLKLYSEQEQVRKTGTCRR